MADHSNEFNFIINEDGSITRKKYTPIDRSSFKGEYTSRPTIMKFYCSSDHMTCGEQVKVFWAIQDADEVSVTISQGGYSTTESMPAEGGLTLTSNISSDDITITITARNSNGIISSRKTIALKKSVNTVYNEQGGTLHDNSDVNVVNVCIKSDEARVNDQLADNSTPANEKQSATSLQKSYAIDIKKKTWCDIESILFKAFKDELKRCCSPSNFIVPYNHDKIELANELIIKIDNSKSLADLKDVYVEMKPLEVAPTCHIIYEYLCEICKPTRFVGEKEDFRLANDLYCRILGSEEDYEEQIILFEEAKLSIKLSDPADKRLVRSRGYIIFILVCEIINTALLVCHGFLYNATSYFYPIQTKDVAKYDYTEFIVYGSIPILVYCLIKFIYFKNKQK